MFLLNSCLSLFSAAHFHGHPFSRSYGVILPSSLTMLLPSALVFSTYLPVSVCGTGTVRTIAAFLDASSCLSPTSFRSSRKVLLPRGFSYGYSPFLSPGFPFRVGTGRRVPTVLSHSSTGISTCRPSATALALVLGPDLPRADQLYPGNLRYSARRILTSVSLLIPAFSLPRTPHTLSIMLLRSGNAPLPSVFDAS